MTCFPRASVAPAAMVVVLAGCSSPLDTLERDIAFEPETLAPLIADAGTASASERDGAVGVEAIGPESDLAACLAVAAEQSPELRASYLDWRARLERRAQATALPDLRVSYGYFIEEVRTRTGDQEHRVGLAQPIPWPSELEARGAVADAESAMAFDRFRAEALRVFRGVREAYVELAWLRSAIALTEESLELLGQVEAVARSRYRVAAEDHRDLVRIQVELGTLQDRVARLHRRRPALEARLNAALGLEPSAAAPWPDRVPGWQPQIDPERLAALLAARHPALSALEHEGAAARRRAELAEREAWPDLTVSVDYIVTSERDVPGLRHDGNDPVVAGVMLSIPIDPDRYDAAAREALHARLASASRRRATELRLGVDLAEATAMLEDAHRSLVLHRDQLVPRAEEALGGVLVAYQAASGSFDEVLDAQRVLLELRLTAVRADADGAIARARIEALTGAAIPDSEGDAS